MQSHFYSQIYKLEENYWWYKSRRNLVKQFIPSHKKLKILDIGCGTGKLMEELGRYGEVYGVDASQEAINFCRQRHLGHLYKSKFPQISPKLHKKRFDLITCLDVIEHISDDKKAMQRISQLLKPNGKLIITVPAYSWLFSYWDKISGHHRRYSISRLLALLNHNDFRIVKISYLYSFLLPIAIPFRFIRHQLFKNKPPQSDLIKLAYPANLLLFTLATLERILLKYINLPFGLSLICIAQKP